MASTPLKILSSMATREALNVLLDHYRQALRQPVDGEAAGGVAVAQRVLGGEAVDVVVLASDAIDRLIDQGAVLRGTRVDLMQSGIAVAVRDGARQPDIGDESAVKAAVTAARTVSFSTGPSGVYLQSLFARWGLLDTLRERIIVPPPGVPVGSLIAQGAADLGFQQLSEFLHVPGVRVVGPLPPAIQHITIFSGAIAVRSAQREAARGLLEYLAAPAAAGPKRQQGMEPMTARDDRGP